MYISCIGIGVSFSFIHTLPNVRGVDILLVVVRLVRAMKEYRDFVIKRFFERWATRRYIPAAEIAWGQTELHFEDPLPNHTATPLQWFVWFISGVKVDHNNVGWMILKVIMVDAKNFIYRNV